MMKTVRAALAAALVLTAGSAFAGSGEASTKDRFSSFDFPVAVTSTDQGSFTGTLSLHRFAVENGQLVAVATLSGTLTDEGGLTTLSVTTLTIPLSTTTASTITCDGLTLNFGPVDQDQAGLAVHLDGLSLNFEADPQVNGNLLHNLLCAAAKFQSTNKLPQLAAVLNRILQLVV